ncbi:CDC25-like phosphatase YCH1 [Pseudozyma hubeiensis]|nr:CDC25-like phosphatase YCH1 [Pseudozyma hubeiensis]
MATSTTDSETQQARIERLQALRRKFSTPPPPPHPSAPPRMSFQPLYKYIDRDSLADQVRKHGSDPSQRQVAIVDVRDDDFEGGNILNAQNHPSSTFPDKVQDLVYGPLKDYKQVIFHCHLSQQRGPKAAGQYAQARQAAIDAGKLPKGEADKQQQEVLVLRGGFSEFQDKYKKDAAVVEKYDASAWEFRN